jgi:hypothetical protein
MNLLILSSVGVTIGRGMDWMIGFIDTLHTPLGTTGNYSAIAYLNTLQFTVTHTHYGSQSITVSTSRFLATDFSTGTITVTL